MSNLSEKLKNCSEQELKDFNYFIDGMLEMPLINAIDEVIDCLEKPDYCEHYDTHWQFLKQSYIFITYRIEDDIKETKEVKTLFKKNSILIDLIKPIEFWLKIIKLSVNFYKCNEWDIKETYIRKPTIDFYHYSNSLHDAIYDELEARKKKND
ncbi:Uncharacterised protein (plasmid) [Mesomycoplasma conjunctivae]|nr:hypothetical protein [Mycoplasmopsis fermentans]ADV34109.1 Hypothetical Protein MfeM64YM_0100 [Mycoplasmopsis fermentans M64]VEU60136.1 Uncharacterised protein [Mycoplasmopsis fermentans]VEU66856.1 Uncharacterised protein [Mesomycoplasma conjunctivae]